MPGPIKREGNPALFGDTLTAGAAFNLAGIVTMAVAGGSANDVAIASGASAIDIDATTTPASGDQAWTGMGGGVAGRIVLISNRQDNGTFNHTLVARSTSSLLANRFNSQSDIVLGPGDASLLQWFPTIGSHNAGWRVIAEQRAWVYRSIPGCITIPLGNSGGVIATGVYDFGPAPATYDFSGWTIASDLGRIRVEIIKGVIGSAGAAPTYTSMSGSSTFGTTGVPNITSTGGVFSNASTSLAGWTGSTTLNQGEFLRANVLANASSSTSAFVQLIAKRRIV